MRRLLKWRRTVRWIITKKQVIVLTLLTMLVGLCTFRKRTTYHYVDENLTSLQHRLKKYQELTTEVCPEDDNDQFCDAPCWNGVPFREPNFILAPNCTEHSKRNILIYIYSRPGNRKERATMRTSFINQNSKDYLSNYLASLMFVVGIPQNKTEGATKQLQMDLKREYDQHGDILQIDIPDVYFNLGFKGLGALKYISQCGTSLKHVVKLDDDSLDFIEFKTVYSTINSIIQLKYENYNYILCLHAFYNVIVHAPKYKEHWETSFTQYFSRHFPTYCFGNKGIFMTRQAAVSLYQAAKGRRVFHIDDVYITGLLRRRACVSLVDWSNMIDFFLQVALCSLDFISETHSYEVISRYIDRHESTNLSAFLYWFFDK